MRQFEDMDQAYEDYAKSKGMNYLSLVVLEEIYESGEGCTQKRISDETRYPKQSVNLTVKSFLDDGYITLEEMPENRRNKRIKLNEKGRRLCEDVIVPLLGKENAAMDGMSDAERDELARLLGVYCRGYCDRVRELI